MKLSIFAPIALLAVFVSGLSEASVARPAVPQVACPEWSSRGKLVQSTNGSYLSSTSRRKRETLNDLVFLDEGSNRAMRTEYENRVDLDEKLTNTGLAEPALEKSRFQAMKDLARRAADSVMHLRLKMEGDNITRSLLNSPVRGPVAAAVLAASFYTGRAMNFKVGQHVRMTTTTALKDRAASVSMQLPAPGLTSTVGYNPGEQMSAQLSQQITDKVSAGVNSANRGSAQVTYSVSF